MEFECCYMVLLLLAYSTSMRLVAGREISVLQHGAVGDGKSDDSKAFLAAWNETCGDPGSPTMILPKGKTFLLSPIIFEGKCKSSIHFQVEGKMLAPSHIWTWDKYNNYWIAFRNIDNLTVDGNGEIDGNGKVWWSCRETNKCNDAPYAIGFSTCNNLKLSGVSIINSPMKHVTIYNTITAVVTGFTMASPGDSPNTDGLYISSSRDIQVSNATIGTGDDCVAIGNDVTNINITNIICGPGHGISIGSLGRDGNKATVDQITVSSCNFTKTTNGVRIKTWQGGSGVAKGITFKDINFNEVENPIIIDQFYCNGNHNCPNKTTAVELSDIHYIGLRGSSASDLAISLNCSQVTPCTGVTMEDVNIYPSNGASTVSAFCTNANGEKGRVEPPLPCLKGP